MERQTYHVEEENGQKIGSLSEIHFLTYENIACDVRDSIDDEVYFDYTDTVMAVTIPGIMILENNQLVGVWHCGYFSVQGSGSYPNGNLCQ